MFLVRAGSLNRGTLSERDETKGCVGSFPIETGIELGESVGNWRPGGWRIERGNVWGRIQSGPSADADGGEHERGTTLNEANQEEVSTHGTRQRVRAALVGGAGEGEGVEGGCG
ncbi:uncharacterized protein N7484_003841 [Penicillium longicatenatum]|uniref:uncharacterized protein n=1 Tax=Penicillium longicatenatum TaxID=1561947 RepID=UPI002547E202|nr:uncharacterized protein N7484_003841 [Penicillium longicatenatum]KAJ5650118.1 hypothetical protein N7484_003841 [Penicillium longicatenatum]